MTDKIRPSKVMLTFGPGSIVDLPDNESVMVMGVDFWNSISRIVEPRLAKKKGVDFFGSPENWLIDDKWPAGLPVRDFPYFRVCPSCSKLWHVSKLKYNLYCPRCQGKKTIPVRLVAACRNGHIQDFPWATWCNCKCDPSSADLYLEGRTGSVESDLMIVCRRCGAHRGLTGALDILETPCEGERPWMGDKEDCGEKLKGLLRGASNVYFADIDSSFSIPPFSKKIYRLISNHYSTAKRNWETHTIRDYIQANQDVKDIMEKCEFTVDEMEQAFNNMYDAKVSNLKIDEWNTLIKGTTSDPTSDFRSEKIEIPSDSPLRAWFNSVCVLDKIREVTTLTGFSRIWPYEKGSSTRIQTIRFNQNELDAFKKDNKSVSPAPQSDTELKWFPGIELFGEGIFLEFKPERVAAWEKDPEVIRRCKSIVSVGASLKRLPREREGIDFSLPRTILIHTFAHLLIKRISLSCGYSQASMRERVYSCDTDSGRSLSGVVIYTVSPDSEGSLGGLVAQAAKHKTLENHIDALMENIQICSQDPLCASHDCTTTGNPWGASCHSCCQLSETSCEGLQNKLLDRWTLMGGNAVKGFFAD